MKVYDFKMSLGEQEISLEKYRDFVLLIVNVASKCGFTPQYKELRALKDMFSDRKFEILAFPCNQFGSQEPGEREEIQHFCQLNYDINFPVFNKIKVNGDKASPLYQWLKQQQPGLLRSQAIKWNFTKFLINASGDAIERYAPQTSPLSIKQDIEPLFG